MKDLKGQDKARSEKPKIDKVITLRRVKSMKKDAEGKTLKKEVMIMPAMTEQGYLEQRRDADKMIRKGGWEEVLPKGHTISVQEIDVDPSIDEVLTDSQKELPLQEQQKIYLDQITNNLGLYPASISLLVEQDGHGHRRVISHPDGKPFDASKFTRFGKPLLSGKQYREFQPL